MNRFFVIAMLLLSTVAFSQDKPKSKIPKIVMEIDTLKYSHGRDNMYMDYKTMASISALYGASYEDAKSRQYAQHTENMKNGKSEEKQENGKTYLYEAGEKGMHRFEFYIVKDGDAAIILLGLSKPDTPNFTEDLKKAALSARKAIE